MMSSVLAFLAVVAMASAAPFFPYYNNYNPYYSGFGPYFPGYPGFGFHNYYGNGFNHYQAGPYAAYGAGGYGAVGYGGAGYGAAGYGGSFTSKQAFHGLIEEKCEDKDDGLYYVDDTTFAFCHNGEKTIQPCAEGSINPPIENFQEGRYYGLYDFCSVNINQFLAPGYGGFPRYNQERPANEYLEDTKY